MMFRWFLKYLNERISHPDTVAKKMENLIKPMVFAHFRPMDKWIFRRFVCLKQGKRQNKRDEEIQKERNTIKKLKAIENKI